MESDNPERQMNVVRRMTKEEIAASCRRREHEEFMQWAKNHGTGGCVRSIYSGGILLEAGNEQYRYYPHGGFTIEDWPDLKAICDSGDDELTHLDRDEIVGQILRQRLISQGHTAYNADTALRCLAESVEPGHLSRWFEESVFEELIANLSEYIEVMDETWRSQAIKARYSLVPVVPRRRAALRCDNGREFPLSPKGFKLLDALKSAPENALEMRDVLRKVWGLKRAVNTPSRIGNLRRHASDTSTAILETGLVVRVKKVRNTERVWVTLEMPSV